MEHWGVQPDIFTIAKGLTSGYLPIGAAVVSGRVAEAFAGEGDAFQHLITFGGNPASCAAALANLDIMEDEGMAARSAEMGAYLFERMQGLRAHAIVGDVRGGKGLLCAIELVKDRATRAGFPKEAKLDKLATQVMRENRMLGRAGAIIPIAPPLCITREEIDEAVRRLDKVCATLGERLGVA
jgi:adenosylmethionine-8-amino-7-oxononanoate aminotransferase